MQTIARSGVFPHLLGMMKVHSKRESNGDAGHGSRRASAREGLAPQDPLVFAVRAVV